MPTRLELTENNIFEWNLIQARYENPSLLLGNGFSLMFSNNFSYSSLFQLFLGNCDERYRELFEHFDTTNFELIQKYLTYAHKVNSILELPIDQITNALNQLKNGLIQTIEHVHPRTNEIDFDQLENIARQLENFGDIFTTNYDLYLYHIIMLSKDLSLKNRNYIAYQDWFWGNNAPEGFKEFMSDQAYRYKNLFYLHGSLVVFNRGVMNIKLLKNNNADELINLVSNEIRNDNFPIFVTEGSGAHKLESIKNNNYLTFCLNKLRRSNNPIIIFGNAMGDFDSHILDAIKESIRDIVYCIFPGDRTIEQINAERYGFLSKFNNYGGQIDFVDSTTVFEL